MWVVADHRGPLYQFTSMHAAMAAMNYSRLDVPRKPPVMAMEKD